MLYAAYDLATAIAETIVRDRFEGVDERVLDESEIEDWAIAEVTAIVPLVLVDLRTTGLLRLGVSTDAARAKQHNEGQTLSEAIHERYAVDDCSIPHALRRQTVWQSMTVLSARNLSPLQPSSSCSKPA